MRDHENDNAADYRDVVTIDPDSAGSSVAHFANPMQGSFLVRKHRWRLR